MMLKFSLGKLSSLAFVALPGFSRLVIFYIAALMLDTNSFASFSSAYSLAVVVAMVGAIGSGLLILKDEIAVTVSSLLKFTVISVIVSLPIFFIFFLNSNDVELFVYLFLLGLGLSANQVLRHSIILEKKFFLGACYETVLILSSLICIFSFTNHLILSIGISYIFISITFSLIKSPLDNNNNNNSNSNNNIKSIMVIGYSNLASSGILFLLPTFSTMISEPEVTKVTSLLVSVIGIVTVFPRAIYNLKVIDFKRLLEDRDVFNYKLSLFDYRKKVYLIMALGIFFVNSYALTIETDIPKINIFIYSLMMSSFICIGQAFMPETNMMNFINKEKYLMFLNFFVFFLFFLSFLIIKVLNFLDGFYSIQVLCLLISFLYAIRSALVIREIEGYISSPKKVEVCT
ncbi:hypothetical protein CGJ08_19625 [Vibrio parahaemolyticus]|uniref:hypothetical protein n=1 Tax=Vibrio parahaemolyticus TaxID=670 RepID=UPI00112210E3|nr:hypothetical protein [Vibrio parahaemolyticus]TOG10849.1 hypothetical protein CGJ08_19625 [Vibrio parahaemolyticus]